MHFIIYDHGTGMKDALILIKIIVSYDTVAMYLCALNTMLLKIGKYKIGLYLHILM